MIEEMDIYNAYDYAVVNTKSWIESYGGIVDQEFLDKINTDEEINKMRDTLVKYLDDGSKRFLLKVDGEYAGLFRVKMSKYEKYANHGELGALYLLNKYKNNGYGKLMFERAIEELKKMGYKKMIVGCLEKNPTNEFYKHMGCKYCDKNPITIGKQQLKENLYTYDL